MNCSINGCTMNDPEPTSFHLLFRNGKFDELWISAIRGLNGQHLDWSKTTHGFTVCSKHFEKRYIHQVGATTVLTRNAVPTIFPRVSEKKFNTCRVVDQSSTKEPSEMTFSSDNENVKDDQESSDSDEDVLSEQEFDIEELCPPMKSKHTEETQTDIENLKKENVKLRKIFKKKYNDLKFVKQKVASREKTLQQLNDLIIELKKSIQKCPLELEK